MIRTAMGAAAVALMTLGSITGCALGETHPIGGVETPTWVVGSTTPDPGTPVPSSAFETPGPVHGPSIPEGTWVVGEDAQSGTYKTQDVVTELCFWTVTDKGDLVSDAGGGAGKPKVTLRDGDTFMSMNCGTWVMQ